jgi:hypothetical protein
MLFGRGRHSVSMTPVARGHVITSASLRRGLGPLLLAAALAAALAGCGSGTPVLRYSAAGPVPLGQLRTAVRRMQRRLRDYGLQVRVLGPATGAPVLSVAVSRPLPASVADALGEPARLRFYDWEADVIGPAGVPAGSDPAVSGGPLAGDAAYALPRYDAVLRAAGSRSAVPGPGSWYLLDPVRRRVLAGPLQRRPAGAAGGRAIRVAAGTVLLRALPAGPGFAVPDRWYVLADRPFLTGLDVVQPRATTDAVPGGTGEPIVSFALTPHGQRALRDATRLIASRGAASPPSAGGPPHAFQHFAIAVDSRLVSVPYVDFATTPQGLDPTGRLSIVGALTAQNARILAAQLAGGPLPVSLLAG